MRRLEYQGNLGFGGGNNRGAAVARAPWLFFLNPDAAPRPGALEALAAAPAADPAAAGFVPALENADGTSQCAWQLQPLPSAFDLLRQVFFLGGRRGPAEEPEPLAAIGQPAAAALMVRRELFERLGGFDADTFYPAWFEDVDLARRLAGSGAGAGPPPVLAPESALRFWPASRFRHRQGSSVSRLGYGPFLWLYDRHLCRYLAKHHGAAAAGLARLLLPLSALLRLLALPLRRPRRAATRADAAWGLWAVALGALSAFRRPAALAERFRPDL